MMKKKYSGILEMWNFVFFFFLNTLKAVILHNSKREQKQITKEEYIEKNQEQKTWKQPKFDYVKTDTELKPVDFYTNELR